MIVVVVDAEVVVFIFGIKGLCVQGGIKRFSDLGKLNLVIVVLS